MSAGSSLIPEAACKSPFTQTIISWINISQTLTAALLTTHQTHCFKSLWPTCPWNTTIPPAPLNMLLLPSTEVALSNHCYRSHLLSSLGYCRPVFLTLACQRDEWLSQLMTDNKKPNLSSLFRACGFFTAIPLQITVE